MIDAKQLERLSNTCGRWLIVARCLEGDQQADGSVKKGNLYLPDHYAKGGLDGVKFTEISQVTAARHNWVELIDVGVRCKIFKREYARVFRGDKPGLIAMCPELPGNKFEVAEEGYSFVDERTVTPILFHPDGRIEPMADIVLLELDRNKANKNIDVASDYEHAQKFATVIDVGAECKYGLKAGDRVVLAQDKQQFYIPVVRNGEKWLSIVREDRIIAQL